MKKEKEPDKPWFVVFLDGRAVQPPVLGSVEAWAIASKYPGSIQRHYRTFRDALKAIERGPDYEGDKGRQLF